MPARNIASIAAAEPAAAPAAIVPKAAELVARRLRAGILRGETPVGEPLPSEADLMERFDVSRPTLRAALRILETESLVEVRRGSRGGTWAREPAIGITARRAGAYLQYHRATIDDVQRARALVEPPALAMLADRRDPEVLALLRATLDEEERALEDQDQVRVVGQRFHSELVQLAGNQTLIVFSAMLEEIIDRVVERNQTARRQQGRARAAPALHGEHRRAFELVSAGAAEEAELYWRSHLEHVRANLVIAGDTPVDLLS
jgi:DNA-binding FadR family transcriptional regulator